MRCALEVGKLFFKWFDWRGGRGKMNWVKYMLFLSELPLAKLRIIVNLL